MSLQSFLQMLILNNLTRTGSIATAETGAFLLLVQLEIARKKRSGRKLPHSQTQLSTA